MKNIEFNSTHIASGQQFPSYDENPLLNNKDIILPPKQNYILKIDYPLTKPAKFQINSGSKGVSRGKLVSLIRKYYKQVYKIEDSSTKIKPSQIPNMFNRNSTDGKFGIWGHCIEDLVLVDCSISKNNVISLGVDS